MKVSIQIPAIQPIETFLSYLKDRADDPVHQNNAHVIADFVDRFLVVEMKRLETSKESVTTEVDVPDDIITKPLEQARHDLDVYKSVLQQYVDSVSKMNSDVKDFFNKKGLSTANSTPSPAQPSPAQPTSAQPSPAQPTSAQPTPAQPTPAQTNTAQISPSQSGTALSSRQVQTQSITQTGQRNGNGHVSRKKRDLTDSERDALRYFFLHNNGEVGDDRCAEYHKGMDQIVTVFQVTGFISVLHSYVACGKLRVRDTESYLKVLRNNRVRWTAYNSEENIKARKEAESASHKS